MNPSGESPKKRGKGVEEKVRGEGALSLQRNGVNGEDFSVLNHFFPTVGLLTLHLSNNANRCFKKSAHSQEFITAPAATGKGGRCEEIGPGRKGSGEGREKMGKTAVS